MTPYPAAQRPFVRRAVVTYGVMINSLPIIVPNAVTFLLSAPLLVMKLRYRQEH